MRHQKKGFKLGRTHAHRKATLAALSNALIKHKRITTTLTKARALRMHVEPIINRAKVDSMHNRRQAFRYLQNKHSVTELFTDIAEKIGDRPGGYTRIVKLGQRAGDAAEMAIIELVDYNADAAEESTRKSGRRRTRRGSRRGKSSTAASGAAAASGAGTESEDAPLVDQEPEDTDRAGTGEAAAVAEADASEVDTGEDKDVDQDVNTSAEGQQPAAEEGADAGAEDEKETPADDSEAEEEKK